MHQIGKINSISTTFYYRRFFEPPGKFLSVNCKRRNNFLRVFLVVAGLGFLFLVFLAMISFVFANAMPTQRREAL